MKKIVLLCFLMTCVISLHAQDAKSVFINIPDSLCPLLTKVNREDFADFLESKMKAQVKNKMDKMSEMKVLTKDYVSLQTTSLSNFQMKLLQLNDTTKIICVINTVCGPVCDSRISFYTTQWKELPSKDYIDMPGMESFFITPESAKLAAYNDARASLDFYLLKSDLSKDSNELVFTFTSPQNLDESLAKALEPFLKKELVYVWKDGRFALKN
ncbi:DUF3256 family protein [uncultured Bacteroides sp.]|uniref:DUF3256 family protein n=1 Tax=uncultured Bacteroides sp. TaxID=162156 RepID=UPI002AAB1B03|nr:DUF3256 family protein [uncultured Bacteroides sp.]